MPRAAIASPSRDPATRGLEAEDCAGTDAGFRRSDRLHKPKEFQEALGRRAVVRSTLFAIHVLPNAVGWRLGLVVPKRYVSLAVRRNVIKRVWREAFRQCRPALAKSKGRYDLVVRLHAKPKPAPLVEFRRSCRHEAIVLLERLPERLDRPVSRPPCVPPSSI